MGKATSNYLLQESHFDGFYYNRYKFQGKGLKFTKWVTVGGRPSGASDADVKAMFLEAHNARDTKKVQRYRVTFKGKAVISPRGRCYDIVIINDSKPELRYKETLPGCEEL